MYDNLIVRLRERLVAMPKPGSVPFQPGGAGITTTLGGGPHKVGDSAGLQSVSHGPWMVAEHVWVGEPLAYEAADRIAELERELANEKTWSNIVVSQRDGCSASLDAMTRLCRESIRFMEDDFPEDPADIDKACVSAPYLAHYKALLATSETVVIRSNHFWCRILATAETPAEQSASDAVQLTYDAARKCAKDAL